MKITKATINDFETIKHIVHTTINEIYPKYYPCGAVDFFLKHHSDENIKKSILNDNVFLLFKNNDIVGTGTINGNEIDRLFILPEFQGKGLGTEALDYFENLKAIVKLLYQHHSLLLRCIRREDMCLLSTISY